MEFKAVISGGMPIPRTTATSIAVSALPANYRKSDIQRARRGQKSCILVVQRSLTWSGVVQQSRQ